MIRGTTAQFKFKMPKSFSDLCIVEAVFGQKGNVGTIEAPLPIKKIYNRQSITVDTWDSDGKNINQMYFDGTNYYKYENDQWVTYNSVAEAARNDGLQPDPNNPQILLTSLSAAETMRFSDKRKGYVQVITYCDEDNLTIGSLDYEFMIYPIRTDDIVGDLIGPSPTDPLVQILDAGEIE